MRNLDGYFDGLPDELQSTKCLPLCHIRVISNWFSLKIIFSV